MSTNTLEEGVTHLTFKKLNAKKAKLGAKKAKLGATRLDAYVEGCELGLPFELIPECTHNKAKKDEMSTNTLEEGVTHLTFKKLNAKKAKLGAKKAKLGATRLDAYVEGCELGLPFELIPKCTHNKVEMTENGHGGDGEGKGTDWAGEWGEGGGDWAGELIVGMGDVGEMKWRYRGGGETTSVHLEQWHKI
ncbi:hypothetical protein LR48_Vigan11g138500 [Vigna angularis]|uniref:Uncharacterized protein n=1 Tax=Phaseolus angularis TaxID=3914 RepID=A0A0L9VTD9_PHAAN|nr:hypothetical protein LR48_Vigan11g138500 [Vigna angularis]